jgi:hypothetical protein
MKRSVARVSVGLVAFVMSFGIYVYFPFTDPVEAAGQVWSKAESVTGELEIVAECEEAKGQTLYFLKTEKEKLRIEFDSPPRVELRSGMRIVLNGSREGDSFRALADVQELGTASSPVTGSALTGAMGEHKVAVILVNFQDDQSQPFTPSVARDVTFTETSNYFRETSYGQTWLSGDVFGWFTIPVTSASCDTTAIANYAKQAASSAGANLSLYSHYVFAFPQSSGCTFTGRGSIGGNPSQSWINGWYELGVVGHELGHNLGLFHSRSMDCGDLPIGSSCTTSEYGDTFDLMGGSNSGHFTAYQKERLGWLNAGASPPIQTISTSGTYYVSAYGPNGASPKALKILKSFDAAGARTWYYLEHRTAYGFDGYIANYPNLLNGVVVHTGSETNPQDTYLLDMTPLTASWYDPALVTGQTFTDATSNLSITTLSADDNGAWVQVSIGAAQCSRANPTLAVTPGDSNWVMPGTPVTYTATITNNDSGGCSPSSFAIQAAVPAGWTAPVSQVVNLAPGSSASIHFSVASPANTPDGVYSLGLSASNSDSSSTASSQATYTVVSRLTVTTTTNANSYIRSQKATITTRVSVLGSTLLAVPVTVTLTKPNGATVTQTISVSKTGTAVWTYTFNKRTDPIGTYRVDAVSTKNGLTGSGSTSFNVTK